MPSSSTLARAGGYQIHCMCCVIKMALWAAVCARLQALHERDLSLLVVQVMHKLELVCRGAASLVVRLLTEAVEQSAAHRAPDRPPLRRVKVGQATEQLLAASTTRAGESEEHA